MRIDCVILDGIMEEKNGWVNGRIILDWVDLEGFLEVGDVWVGDFSEIRELVEWLD